MEIVHHWRTINFNVSLSLWTLHLLLKWKSPLNCCSMLWRRLPTTMRIVLVFRHSTNSVDRYFKVELFLWYNLILKYLFRLWYGESQATGVVWWRNWSSGTTRTAFGAKGVGGIIRATKNDTTIPAGKSNGPIAVLTLWMLERSSFLSSTEWYGKSSKQWRGL